MGAHNKNSPIRFMYKLAFIGLVGVRWLYIRDVYILSAKVLKCSKDEAYDSLIS